MKAIIPYLLMLIVAAPVFAQTPAGPVSPTPQTPPAASPETAASTPSTPAAPATTPAVQGDQPIVIPKDTTIPLILQNTINTKSAYVGQSIYCESIYPITVGNRIIIPKGSSVRGTVTQVIRPGHVKGRAQLGLRFDELVLPNGTTRHLRATLAGFGSEGDEKFKPKEGQVEGGGSKGKDAETIARTTIPGAEIGTIVGAAKGAPLEGLGIGSAAGAATGLIWILATRGKDVVLPYGTSLELQLTQPVTFDRIEVNPPSHYEEGPMLPRHEYGPRN
jgi:type IV secretion system protein VirB10